MVSGLRATVELVPTKPQTSVVSRLDGRCVRLTRCTEESPGSAGQGAR